MSTTRPASPEQTSPHALLALRFNNRRDVRQVPDIAEASRLWQLYRDSQGLGASESPRVTVIDLSTGSTIASISYNGRAWDRSGKEIPLA